MSMGYDEDDPRAAATRAKFRAGVWKLQPGDKPALPLASSVRHKPAWHGSFTK